MKTGSLINNLLAQNSNKPEVGMGATLLSWTDRDPATVIAWDDKKLVVTVQHDDYQRIDKNGFSESQAYEYTQNDTNPTETFKWTKKGWVRIVFNKETNRWNQRPSGGLYVGRRERFYDFSF